MLEFINILLTIRKELTINRKKMVLCAYFSLLPCTAFFCARFIYVCLGLQMKIAENICARTRENQISTVLRIRKMQQGSRVKRAKKKLLHNFCKCFFFAFFRNHCRFSEICSAEFNIDTIHCCTDNGFGFFFLFWVKI